MRNNNIKKLVLALSLSLAGSGSAIAGQDNNFIFDYGSIKVGYANWDMGLEDVGRGDLLKMFADYGAIYKGYEYYGFMEYNRFDHPDDTRNQVFTANTHIRLFDSNFTAFGKFYAQYENNPQFADDVSTILGMGYLGYSSKAGFFKPFVGAHIMSGDAKSTTTGETSNGMNGVMVGWVGAYHLSPQFTLSNWNEFEIARNDAYAEQQHGDFGINGGVTLSYKPSQHFVVDVTYRYFYNKLAVEGYGDQIIFMAGYKF